MVGDLGIIVVGCRLIFAVELRDRRAIFQLRCFLTYRIGARE
jgi:hypothetical protein